MSNINKFQIFEQITFGVCSLILSVCFIRFLTIICQYLDFSAAEYSVEYIITYTFTNLIVAIIIGLLVVSFYVNHRYRNFFKRVSMDNKAVLYLMCLPSGIFSLVCYAIYPMSKLDLPVKAAELFIFFILFFFLIVLLGIYIVYTNTHQDLGEEWTISFINLITNMSLFIFLTFHVILHIFYEQVERFKKEIKNQTDPSPHAPKTTFTSTIGVTSDCLEVFYFKFIITFEIICILFLVRPIQRNYRLIQISKRRLPHYTIDVDSLEGGQCCSCIRMFLSSASVTTVIVVVIKQPFAAYIGNILMCLLYVGSIINSFCILSDMMRCPEKGQDSHLLYGFLSLGLFGQTVEAVAEVLYSISLNMYHYILFQNIICVVQCHIQTVLLSFCLNRTRIKFSHSSLVSFLYSTEFLIFSNIGLLALNCYNLFVDPGVRRPQQLYLQLVRSASLNISCILTILFRLTSVIILVPLIQPLSHIKSIL